MIYTIWRWLGKEGPMRRLSCVLGAGVPAAVLGWAIAFGPCSPALRADTVSFPDANLEAVVRELLGIAAPTPITPADMETLVYVGPPANAFNRDIRDLGGLEYAKNVTGLDLRRNRIDRLDPLVGMTGMNRLNLSDNEVVDLAPLCGMTQMYVLHLSRNRITSIAPLWKMSGLVLLIIEENQIEDLSAVGSMGAIETLCAMNNQIRDPSALALPPNLSVVDLSGNPIEDASPFGYTPELRTLVLDGCGLASISGLGRAPKLLGLSLQNNVISDISDLTSLTTLRSLDLRGNPLDELAYSTYIPQIIANNPGVNVLFDPVPEPGTALLVAAGIIVPNVLRGSRSRQKGKGDGR
jgi:Leucine-rich repeat (LRR) protein